MTTFIYHRTLVCSRAGVDVCNILVSAAITGALAAPEKTIDPGGQNDLESRLPLWPPDDH